MFERILARIRELLRTSQYIVTVHAYDEMGDDDFSIWDVESAILGGELVERQRDTRTREMKYRIRGLSLDLRAMEVILKIGPTGKLVIITVYEE